MQSKETFGAYIQQHRRALGMTQREFADKLYVTESAVSKWERGLSYPDVTILRDICQILGVTEHELLTASVDTQARTTEKLAKKYRRLTRNYRIAQYILYGGTLVGCFLGDLCASGHLDWFFIALASVLLCACMTLLPSLLFLWGAPEKQIGASCTLASFAALLLLLGVCCLYSGGSWFFIAASGVLLGFCVIFVPFLLPKLPLSAAWERRKASICLALDLLSLLLLLAVCAIDDGGSWLPVTVVSVVFGLGFFLLPVFLRQFPLPMPFAKHKALLYFSVQTVLLFALLLIAVRPWQTFFRVAVPSALVGLSLPWSVMLLVRYLPANGLVRAGSACGAAAVWTWLLPWALDTILVPYYGPATNGFGSFVKFDLLNWSDPNVVSLNVLALIVFTLAALAVGLVLAGLLKKEK